MSRLGSEAKAWACLGANALVLPGLGSLVAGKWVAGLAQAGLSLVGFVMTMLWLIGWLGRAAREATIPLDPGPGFDRGLLGLALFGIGWAWGVLTGVLMLRRASRQRQS